MEPNQLPFPNKPYVEISSGQVRKVYKPYSRFTPLKWLIGIIGIILVLVILIAVLVSNFRPSGVNDLLNSFCISLSNNDYVSAYNDTSIQYQHKVSATQFISLIEGGQQQGYSNCSLSNIHEDDSLGTGSGTITTINSHNSKAIITALLVNDNGTWKINELIYPIKPPSS